MKTAAKKPAAKAKKKAAPAAKRPTGPAKKPAKQPAKRPAKQPTAAKRKPKPKPAAASPAARKPAPRADSGAPIDGFFARQPQHLRPILEALRALVEEVVPEAASSIKWGMPMYTLNDAMLCGLGGHKSHVNLILAGPPGTFDDPEGRLIGEGKTGKHLKLTSLDDLPHESVRGWLRAAAARVRG
ncbi:MAG: DUF1801 domain-containing protein [Deltaproteobacteria bacterium]|nr:DUF1801 domain-containing protein [Deltaproteobacteria bacterium]